MGHEAQNDMVNHPKHYTFGKFEVIEVIEAWHVDARLANAIKYIARAGKKERTIQDLEKAEWYIDRAIEIPYAECGRAIVFEKENEEAKDLQAVLDDWNLSENLSKALAHIYEGTSLDLVEASICVADEIERLSKEM